ncbi:MAG TPA: hypothetical protein VHH36_02990 [Candidatus Thermoplasmatota archaeon]|nr:hypothetical protein [Candidatus Thermoplasmatota archaeon]
MARGLAVFAVVFLVLPLLAILAIPFLGGSVTLLVVGLTLLAVGFTLGIPLLDDAPA